MPDKISSHDGLGTGRLPRRRNGKEQACECCRKAKIACDHTLPVCDRCKRRKIASKCVYLAAPMTRPVPDGSRTRSEPTLTNLPLTPSTGSLASPTSPTSLRDASAKPTPESGPFIKSGGFFGKNFSSLPTVFQDIHG